ncbi:MAG: hypothetical protein AAB581_02270 [Patescibacteria group bacterium]
MTLSKHRVVHGIAVALALAISLFIWSIVRADGHLVSAGDIGALVGLLTLFLALYTLSAFLFSVRELYVIAAAFLLGFLIFFGVTPSYVLGGILAAALFFMYGSSLAHIFARERTVVRFFPLATRGIPTILTAVAVLFAVVGYAYALQFDDVEMSSATISFMMPVLEPFAEKYMPPYKKGMTIDEFLAAGVPEEIQQAAQRDSVTREALAGELERQRGSLGTQFDIPVTGNERLADLLTALANKYVNKTLGAYKDIAVPFLISVSVFFAIKSLGLVVNRVAVFVAWLASLILAKSGVVRREKAEIEQEALTLKKSSEPAINIPR